MSTLPKGFQVLAESKVWTSTCFLVVHLQQAGNISDISAITTPAHNLAAVGASSLPRISRVICQPTRAFHDKSLPALSWAVAQDVLEIHLLVMTFLHGITGDFILDVLVKLDFDTGLSPLISLLNWI
jgi:hypothetical protein